MNAGQYSRPSASTISTLTIASNWPGDVAVVLLAEARAGGIAALAPAPGELLVGQADRVDLRALPGGSVRQRAPAAADLEQAAASCACTPVEHRGDLPSCAVVERRSMLLRFDGASPASNSALE